MKVLIAIHGSHAQPEQMQAQRETWLRDLLALGVDYKFFVGDPATGTEDVAHVPHPDGPIWDRPVNGRRTWCLNRKTEALAQYALENGYDFAFKCDDDTYALSSNLIASGFENHDYSGFTNIHHASGLGFYRWAQGGAGYWLSRRSMGVIAENGLHLVRAEDFAVGQLLAKHGIHPHHGDRYNATSKPISADWITLHKIGAELMRTLHRGAAAEAVPATEAE